MLAPWRDEPLRILEVGSWEGRSALFFLRFFPNATIVCIDAFAQYPETEGRFDRNLSRFGTGWRRSRARSFPPWNNSARRTRHFDLVYIDADHF
jgi:predicted O-methyltransferase YrrM